jgi:hypothetical protein
LGVVGVVAHEQTPPTQVAFPEHTCPQLPQLWLSVLKFTQPVPGQ